MPPDSRLPQLPGPALCQAVLLGIHAAMVSRAWSTLRLGWYVAWQIWAVWEGIGG